VGIACTASGKEIKRAISSGEGAVMAMKSKVKPKDKKKPAGKPIDAVGIAGGYKDGEDGVNRTRPGKQ